jgi:hypothetical protein
MPQAPQRRKKGCSSMADPTAGDVAPAKTQNELDELEMLVRFAADSTDEAQLHQQVREQYRRMADKLIAQAETLVASLEGQAVKTHTEFGEAVAGVAGTRAIGKSLADAAAAIARAQSAFERSVRDAMLTLGIGTITAAGYRFQVVKRNDMAIVDLDAAVADVSIRGMSERIMSAPRVDRTLVLGLARDLEDAGEKIDGVERVPSTTFSVKEAS